MILRILVYSCSIVVLCTVANAFTPLITTGASSSFVEGKAMYISGGFNRPQRVVPQTFAIDLSSDWDTSSPKTTELSTINSLQDAVVPNAALSSDGRLVVFSNGYSSIFNPTTNQWSNPTTVRYFNPKDAFHLAAAADPRTGLVYVPSGYVNGTGNATVTSMLQYDPVKGISNSLPMTNGPGIVKGYSIIWSDYIKKFVIYGGYIDADPVNILSTYDPASRTWTQVSATYPPPTRVRHCAVPRMGGKKMLIFAGFVDSAWTQNLEDLWELDLETYVWSKGSDATGLGRGLMACAVSNNHFISWGGQDKTGVITQSPTLVYNLNSGTWTSSYQSGSVLPTPKRSNVGIIVAVVVSIVVLLAAVAIGLWYWRRRRVQRRKQLLPDATGRPIPDSEVGGGGTQGHSRPMSEISEKPSWTPAAVDAEEEKLRHYHRQQQLQQQQQFEQQQFQRQQMEYITEPRRPSTIEYQHIPEPQSPDIWAGSQGTVVQSPASVCSYHAHSHNPQLRYPDNLDYFPPPPPVTCASARTSYSAPGSATAMYNNSVLHDGGVKVEFTQPPVARSPQEIMPYAQPLDVDISDPQGFVVPNNYRE
ncbi:hypothetical protein BG003_010228 [Podila horticola]|nr:hypothetical protein BG003_010228 [Podila horticola]